MAEKAGLKLGEVLLKTIHEEQTHSVDLAKRRAMLAGGLRLQDWQRMTAFVEEVRTQLTRQIGDGIPSHEVGVAVPECSSNSVSEPFELLNMRYVAQNGGFDTRNEYYPLILDLDKWAAGQQLKLLWTGIPQEDGRPAWYGVKVEPIKIVHRGHRA